ncbi:DUF2292 domain-containing protein [Pelosinus sp. sgz500959]|uniref:DUF2292 domain-containing protein n=1 Tax=Pelosinus sp. sgz500959 TaxID=3242472 RepID=UPI00366AD9B0
MVEFLVNNRNAVTELNRGGANVGKMSQIKPLPSQVFDIIECFLYTVQYGQLILVIQDGIVVKIEKIEKFVISSKNRDAKCLKVDKSLKKHPLQTKILTELQSIRYGQLVIRLDNGQVEQIEKTEKRRINELEGLYGDGI